MSRLRTHVARALPGAAAIAVIGALLFGLAVVTLGPPEGDGGPTGEPWSCTAFEDGSGTCRHADATVTVALPAGAFPWLCDRMGDGRCGP